MRMVGAASLGMLGVVLMTAAVVGVAQSPASAPPTTSGSEVAVPVPATTPVGSGRFRAVMESDQSLPTHTLYRPANLAALEQTLMPIVVWGNGACANTGNRFRWFLSEIASYGFLVIAAGPIGAASLENWPPPVYAPLPASDGKSTRRDLPPPATHSEQLITAMNWAISENDRAGSRFYHRLDPGKVAAMGQSCGGVQAIEVSSDPRITTTVVLNSGLLPAPTQMAGGKLMSKSDLALLHAPIAYISGDSEDIAFANANDDFERLDSIPVIRAYESGVPHEGTYRQPGGGEFGGVVVAWLKWQLQHDARAGRMFTGADCGLCDNPRWVVRKKGIR